MTPWTVTRQAPLSMGFSSQEHWSKSSVPSPGNLPNIGIQPVSLASPALAGGFFTTSASWEALILRAYTSHLGSIILSEISWSEKDRYYMICYLHVESKKKKNDKIVNMKKDTHRESKLVVTSGEREVGSGNTGVGD